jgi:SAM-dependent methyltransferase
MEEYKRKTIEAYDRDAPGFAEKFKTFANHKEHYELERFRSLLPGPRVLNLGCGGGDYASIFVSRGLDVTCIDLSAGMIALCRVKGLAAHVMDIEDLQFPPASFDGVWAVTSLLHIRKTSLPSVIARLHQIIVPDGALYVCVKEGDGESYKQDDVGTERFFAYWRADELTPLFVGFELLEHRRVPYGKNVFLEFFFRRL